MRRPIASFEVGPLVRLLVALSAWVNRRLGLDVPWGEADEAESPENRMGELLRSLRRRRVRLDLRPLADARTLAALPVLWLLGVVALRALALAWWALAAAAQAEGPSAGTVA